MRVKYDQQADAVYVYLSSKPYAYGEEIDHERRIDYAADATPIGVELLCVSDGVNVDGLPQSDEIAQDLARLGIKIYTLGRVALQQEYSGKMVTVAEFSVPTEKAEKEEERVLVQTEGALWTSISHSFAITLKSDQK